MHLEEDENKDDIFGEEYKNYDLLPNLNISEFTGKNETVVENSPNKPIFERIEEKELQNLHHQTELSRDKDDKSNKEKLKIKKKKSFCDDSLKDSSNILNKKTNRDEDQKVKKKEKIKKRKSKMEITSKNYTEINNYEEIKKENEKKIYEAYQNDKKIYESFNQEQFLDMYVDQAPSGGDLFEAINEEDSNAEVNKSKPSYNTQVISNIQETFNMIISSVENQ